MTEYVLLCAVPRPSDEIVVTYDHQWLKAEHVTDNAARRWASAQAPDEQVQWHDGRPACGKQPWVLWRVECGGRRVVWECEPGMAHRVS